MDEEIKVNPTLFTRKSQTNESGFHMRMTYVYGVKSLFLNKRQKKKIRESLWKSYDCRSKC